MKHIFVTGNDTGVGKTVVSAILVQSLGADYWKPVQAGELERTDMDRVKSLVSRDDVRYYPEAYRLSQPMSPHAAAARDGVSIAIDQIRVPAVPGRLIIEGAGGVMVPLNHSELMIDLIARCNAGVVVVVKHYLGSINHTLLTLDALQRRNLDVLGIIFCGGSNSESEAVILAKSGARSLGSIPWMDPLDPTQVKCSGDKLAGL